MTRCLDLPQIGGATGLAALTNPLSNEAHTFV
jgi:hypothetical protein